ncbi:tetraspanin-1-like [Rana temporaria]|uniref:tetraspanin-1-like n=1 Tax=Rana temporaria TaxID=8407 RepID=UPI001AAC998F|nr:tetraspanin-1-like [Rana temporaria]XP_040216877.1 tetraspanin-1-like [Rana temporaria]
MSCFTCIKVLMILFNLAIFLAGGALLGVGIWVSVDSGSFLRIFGTLGSGADSIASQFVNVGYFLIVIGALLVILGFLGCCGAQKESKCLLIMFFSIVLIIFIAEIAGAVVALIYSSVAQSFLKSLLTPVLQEDYGKDQEVTKTWNATMTKLDCCALDNYTDFTNSYYVRTNDGFYPQQCCNATVTNTTVCAASDAARADVKGCYKQILDLLKTNATVVGGVAAGIAALELAAMVVSMYLYCKIDKDDSMNS